jgi:dUTP pyrophosphatase
MNSPDVNPVVLIHRLRPDIDRDIPLPAYMTEHSAGMDIHAALTSDLTMLPGDIHLIPTGFAISLPKGYEAQIRPRSGLAVRHGITVINSPGTIDADYRGEIQIALIHHGKQPVKIHRGDRIAQMIVHRVCQIVWEETDTLDKTGRNTGGFGHTGR